MSNSIYRTIYLILKYSIKRKINKIGFQFNKKKKKNSKSRIALGKKGMGILGIILSLFGALYFIAIGTLMMFMFINQMKQLDEYRLILNKDKLPSSFSESSIRVLDSTLKKRFEKYDELKDKKDKELEWENSKKEFLNSIDFQFQRAAPACKINLDDEFKKYYQTRVIPLEYLSLTNNTLSRSSPYLCLLYLSGGILALFSLFTALSFSVKDLGVSDKYYEWLASNALPINSLFLFRVIENAFTNLINWLIILPILIYVYIEIRGAWSIPIAIFVWLIWSLLIGIFQVLIELYFQHYAGLQKAKIFQSICHIIGTGLMLLASLCNASMEFKVKTFEIFSPYLNVFNWVPFFNMPFLNANNSSSVLSLLFLVIFLAFALYVVIVLSRSLTKNGLVTNATSFSGKRSKGTIPNLIVKKSKLSPIIAFEKLMLFRNKQIFITVLVLPCLLCTYYYYAFSFKTKSLIDPKNINVTAFGLCTYVFLFTTFTLVQREGKGLWLIFTLPIDISEYFFKKIWLWGAFSYFFFILIYLLYFLLGGEFTSEFCINFFIVMIGIAIFAFISTCIGIVGHDPLNTNEAQRASPAYTYLYLYLCGFYVSALFSESLLAKLYILILAFTIAFGLKVKVKSTFNYFFDKNIIENKLTIFEAILLIFFYTSILITVQIVSAVISKDQNIFLSAIISSSILLVILIFCGRVFPEVKKIGIELLHFYRYQLFSFRLYAYVILSLLIAYGYLFVLHRWNLFGVNDQSSGEFPLQYALFAIFLAPLIEEILFRRILFKTMKDHFTPTTAMLYSSCLFALAHPPSSFIPVFCLGCLSCSLYHKNNHIHQSILLHTYYNIGILLINSIN